MTLGQVLRDARARRNLTLRDVERETGISNGHLSLMESGAVQRPSPNNLYKLADLYGTSYALLMELAGFKTPDALPSAASQLADVEDLSALELEQVRRFVGYLRSSRDSGPPTGT